MEYQEERKVPGIGARINEAARACLSVAELARRTKLSGSVIRKWIREESEPTVGNLLAVAGASGLHPHWLFTGSGPKTPSDGKPTSQVGDYSYIPRLDVQVSAGHVSLADAEAEAGRVAFRTDWLNQQGLKTADLAVVEVHGDSMEPTLSHGDSLMVDMSKKSPSDDAIYVIRTNDHIVVKRLQSDLQGGLIIRSDNPNYETVRAPISEVNILGRGVWIGRRL